jgi:hypothetical protein
MKRLLGLTGPAPARLPEPAAKKAASPLFGGLAAAAPGVRAGSAAGASPGVGAGSASAAAAPPDVVSLLMQQNQMLMAMLAKAPGARDPMVDLLGGGAGSDLLDESRVSGARGCAARALLREQMLAKPSAVATAVRKNLTRALDKSTPEPGDMRAFFTQHVALGSYNCLTYFSFLLARLWEDAEHLRAAMSADPSSAEAQRRAELLHMDIALGAVFAEQVSVEGGARYQLGWLLTGLEEPPFATTSQRKPKPGQSPHGRLVEAQWVAAQLAYLKDLDVMQERLRKQRGPEGPGKKDE